MEIKVQNVMNSPQNKVRITATGAIPVRFDLASKMYQLRQEQVLHYAYIRAGQSLFSVR